MTVRVRLLAEPKYAATMTGIPGLEHMIRMDAPSSSIKLADLIGAYRKENPSTDKAKREAIATFQRLIDHAGAKTLDDLTQAKLLAFRTSIEKSGTLKSAGTRAAYYGRIKTIISFGLKVGLDQEQLRAALDRCKVLWTAEALPVVNPRPISREDYHALLTAAGDSAWRAWLLLGLNLCLHMEEVCALKWSDFDLASGTYACVRNKTRRQRIPRAATLWPETLAALKGVPRRGEFVFDSTHGTRFNKNTRIPN
jgi:integrase